MSDTKTTIKSGFWDSVNHDRVYSADDMNKPYDMILTDGIIKGGFAVTAQSPADMTVNVAAGRALLAGKWVDSATQVVTVPANATLYSRVDSVILQIDANVSARKASLVYRTGTAAATPQAPALVNTGGITELRIANITVAAGASSIASGNISDTRGTAACPYASLEDLGINDQIAEDVTAWLAENVDPVGSAVVVDSSLTIAGAAADAKKVGDELTDLKSDLKKYTDNAEIEVTGENLYINLSGATADVNSPTASSSNSNYSLIQCSEGDKFTVSAHGGIVSRAWGFVAQNGDVLAVADASATVTNLVLVAPTNAYYLVINDNTEQTSYYGEFITDRVKASDYGNEINDANIRTLETAVGGEFMINGWKRVSTMLGTDGTKKATSDALHFFECDHLNGATRLTFVFANSTSGSATHWFNQYDADGTLLSYVPLTVSAGTNVEKNVDLESGCVKVVISIWASINGDWLCKHKVAKDNLFKKVSALGDSIIAGYSQSETVTNTYAKLIADTLGATYQNLGISSTPVCPNSDYTGTQNQNAFVYRYSQIASDADLIIIAGGTNDFRHNVPLGTESDTDAKYEETFYGACDYLLKNIFVNHVNAKIVWVSPFHQMWDNTSNTSGLTLSQYLDAIKAKCKKYGVTYIDAFSCSGMNRTTACETAFMPDAIHPNTAGHLLIYKNLMPFFAMT